ncbi:hypothetical protein D9758_001282 [Tetrapyrgos nigripes]|uniref:Uncharacterized protein n=1 Tax=Tetrapyrgos nigripes TaxID=182062 RepID=A0A8H5LU61_9AGAR|nr:hypothetical protein D9758_001282 [Tetrapyrgos nigripes]
MSEKSVDDVPCSRPPHSLSMPGNIFSGPCFGDLSPSVSSTMADPPSLSPFSLATDSEIFNPHFDASSENFEVEGSHINLVLKSPGRVASEDSIIKGNTFNAAPDSHTTTTKGLPYCLQREDTGPHPLMIRYSEFMDDIQERSTDHEASSDVPNSALILPMHNQLKEEIEHTPAFHGSDNREQEYPHTRSDFSSLAATDVDDSSSTELHLETALTISEDNTSSINLANIAAHSTESSFFPSPIHSGEDAPMQMDTPVPIRALFWQTMTDSRSSLVQSDTESLALPPAPRTSPRLLPPVEEHVDTDLPYYDSKAKAMEPTGIVTQEHHQNSLEPNLIRAIDPDLPSSSPPDDYESFSMSSSPLCSSSSPRSSLLAQEEISIGEVNTKDNESLSRIFLGLEDLPFSSSPTDVSTVNFPSSPITASKVQFQSSPVKASFYARSNSISNKTVASSSSNVMQILPSSASANSMKRNLDDNDQPSSLPSSPIPQKPFSSPCAPSKKRKRENERNASPIEIANLSFPVPKRPTVASQKLQRQKLVTPFRSPLMKKPKLEPSQQPEEALAAIPGAAKDTQIPQLAKPETPAEPIDRNKKHRTARAAAQFKSPLSVVATSQVDNSVRMTPTIQTLERKVQILKRALKVKKDDEEETLKGLVQRWTEAGREVACELWELVKNNNEGGDSWGMGMKLGKRKFEGSWGWDDQGDTKKFKSEEDATEMEEKRSMDVQNSAADEDDDRQKMSLGIMLRQLGIDPDTLGWNDEEGVFRGD